MMDIKGITNTKINTQVCETIRETKAPQINKNAKALNYIKVHAITLQVLKCMILRRNCTLFVAKSNANLYRTMLLLLHQLP